MESPEENRRTGPGSGTANRGVSTEGWPRTQLILCFFIQAWLIVFHFHLANHESATVTILGQAFDLTREATLPTLWSSLLSVGVGVVSIAIWAILRGRRLPEDRAGAWFIVGLVFLVFAADDSMAFHERLGSITSLNLLKSLNYPSYPWHITVAPFVALGLLAALIMIWRDIGRGEGLRPMLLLGLGCFAVAFALDVFEGVKMMDMGEGVSTTSGMEMLPMTMLAEEVLEMAGTTIFLYVVSGYLSHLVPRVRLSVRTTADDLPEKSAAKGKTASAPVTEAVEEGAAAAVTRG